MGSEMCIRDSVYHVTTAGSLGGQLKCDNQSSQNQSVLFSGICASHGASRHFPLAPTTNTKRMNRSRAAVFSGGISESIRRRFIIGLAWPTTTVHKTAEHFRRESIAEKDDLRLFSHVSGVACRTPHKLHQDRATSLHG